VTKGADLKRKKKAGAELQGLRLIDKGKAYEILQRKKTSPTSGKRKTEKKERGVKKGRSVYGRE